MGRPRHLRIDPGGPAISWADVFVGENVQFLIVVLPGKRGNRPFEVLELDLSDLATYQDPAELDEQ